MTDADRDSGTLLIGGAAAAPVRLRAAMANRHGLIAGATGTGKTVSLQVLAEQFAALGVPVFLADVKGDLAGLAAPGTPHPRIQERVARIGIEEYTPGASPVVLWDVFGALGHPLRLSVTDIGPLLLARLLGLNDTQTGVLNVAFRVADDEGLLLLDLKDLRALLEFVAAGAATLRARYGNVSAASVGAIQRRLLELESQGGELLFGEPGIGLSDLLRTAPDGRGVINILASERLFHSPLMYSTVLLWLLSELFEHLPEVGDRDRPRLVFFFDEAHLLFSGAPPALVQRIEQVVRLIRSRGVGVFFVTQSPADVPETVLAQLGNRIQHALRAWTPREQQAVRIAARSMRPNPALDAEAVITTLGVGEALVSVLDEKGVPTPVEQVLVAPPRSRIGPLSEVERRDVITGSPVYGVFDQTVDRHSAYEILRERASEAAQQAAEPPRVGGRVPSRRESPVEALVKSAARAIGSHIGRSLIRGVLGSLGRR